MTLRLLCAGAAKGVVEALAPIFREESGAKLDAVFGAVGAMKARFDSGQSCDLIVLSAQFVESLANEGRVLADTIAALGSVPTGVAVRAGDPLPVVRDGPSLRAALVHAEAIYFPDPDRATAGIHFMGVLRKLAIDREVAARLRPFPNGAAAMRALADDGGPGDIGCTQMTEIRYTTGVAAVAPLPPGFDLSTVYSVAVPRDAASRQLARAFATLLTGPRSRTLRIAGGFEI